MGQISKISGVIGKVKKLIQKNRPQKKLVSSRNDVRLIRRARGGKFPKWGQISNINRILSPFERQLIRGSIIAILAAIIWMGGSFALKNRTVVPAVGGKYIEAVVGTPQSINPLFANVNEVDRDITRLVFSGLMRYNEKQELVVDLAKSFEVSDDKKTYTFTLRDDAVWHDGEPFSAYDVVFTIETIQNPLVGSPLQLSFQGVKVTAPDEHTVVFGLNEPFGPFLSALTVGIIPDHIWFDITAENMRLVRHNLQPIGTGPFMFKGFKKEEETGRIHSYELVRNESFYEDPPFIKEFVFQFYNTYDGTEGAIQALREQKVDGLQFVPSDLQEKVKRKHIVLHTLQLPQYTALFINQEKETTLQDRDLREALSYTIDKERILVEAIDSEGRIINSPILLGFPGFDENVTTTPFDMEKAQELLEKKWKKITAEEYRLFRTEQLKEQWRQTLEQTGEEATTSTEVTSSTDSFIDEEISRQLAGEINEAQIFYRKNDDGEILSLTIVTADTPEYRHAAQLIAGSWQEAGIKTDVKFMPPRDIARDVLKEGDYDILLYGVLVGSDPDQYPFWHSSQIKFPGLNLSHYTNRKVDELLENARETINESDVEKLYSEFQNIILTDIPALFLYQPTYTYATTDKVAGIDAEKIAHPSDRFADVTTWYLRTKSKWLQ